jgi:uncharacterized protein YdhG (YjbR/CyaY superfamily)
MTAKAQAQPTGCYNLTWHDKHGALLNPFQDHSGEGQCRSTGVATMPTSKAKFKTIDAYIDSFPPDVRKVLQLLRQTIQEEVPEAQEAIKYGMPTFVFHGNLVLFAAWKNHIGFYPITTEMESSIEELAAYKTTGKGTIQFPLNKPLPLPLIRKIVAFRVKEHLDSNANNS